MKTLPKANKSLGQHWLADKTSLQAMVEAAGIGPKDTVLEIGPGTGLLTDELTATGAKVIALEYDLKLAKTLQQRYSDNKQVYVEHGDVREYDFGNGLGSYKIAANIPYYLTANLLRRLVDSQYKPDIAALLVQKEVAERIAAGPGNMSAISVMVQLYYDVSLGEVVPAHLFEPPPKVDSQILILTKRPQPLFDVIEQKFFNLVKAGFEQKRKKLKTSLAGGVGKTAAECEQLLAKAAISPNARAQELSMQQWQKLYQTFVV